LKHHKQPDEFIGKEAISAGGANITEKTIPEPPGVADGGQTPSPAHDPVLEACCLFKWPIRPMGHFYKSAFRRSRESGKPVKSRHWIPGQARNDGFIKVPYISNSKG
jgi:hypothetical protein